MADDRKPAGGAIKDLVFYETALARMMQGLRGGPQVTPYYLKRLPPLDAHPRQEPQMGPQPKPSPSRKAVAKILRENRHRVVGSERYADALRGLIRPRNYDQVVVVRLRHRTPYDTMNDTMCLSDDLRRLCHGWKWFRLWGQDVPLAVVEPDEVSHG